MLRQPRAPECPAQPALPPLHANETSNSLSTHACVCCCITTAQLFTHAIRAPRILCVLLATFLWLLFLSAFGLDVSAEAVEYDVNWQRRVNGTPATHVSQFDWFSSQSLSDDEINACGPPRPRPAGMATGTAH